MENVVYYSKIEKDVPIDQRVRELMGTHNKKFSKIVEIGSNNHVWSFVTNPGGRLSGAEGPGLFPLAETDLLLYVETQGLEHALKYMYKNCTMELLE
ncbi:MAG TPA: hypothetical protein VI564_04135 [Candidatus Nanoarchaeia archaeon]|nr:hypothetical protein [Candidatus Nanoarchaeia archaeon]